MALYKLSRQNTRDARKMFLPACIAVCGGSIMLSARDKKNKEIG